MLLEGSTCKLEVGSSQLAQSPQRNPKVKEDLGSSKSPGNAQTCWGRINDCDIKIQFMLLYKTALNIKYICFRTTQISNKQFKVTPTSGQTWILKLKILFNFKHQLLAQVGRMWLPMILGKSVIKTTRKEWSASTALRRVWFSHKDKENIWISVNSNVSLRDLKALFQFQGLSFTLSSLTLNFSKSMKKIRRTKQKCTFSNLQVKLHPERPRSVIMVTRSEIHDAKLIFHLMNPPVLNARSISRHLLCLLSYPAHIFSLLTDKKKKLNPTFLLFKFAFVSL